MKNTIMTTIDLYLKQMRGNSSYPVEEMVDGIKSCEKMHKLLTSDLLYIYNENSEAIGKVISFNFEELEVNIEIKKEYHQDIANKDYVLTPKLVGSFDSNGKFKIKNISSFALIKNFNK